MSSEQYFSYIQDINKFINIKIGRYRSTGALSKHVTHQGLCACYPYCKLTTLLQKGALIPNPGTHLAALWVWALEHFIHLSHTRGRTVQLYGFEPWDTSSTCPSPGDALYSYMGLCSGTLHPVFSLLDDILKQCSVIMFTAHSKMKRLFSLYIIYIIINLVHNSLIYLI